MNKLVQDLMALAKSYGLEVRDCGKGHWQVLGRGNLVNYWPESKGKTAQVKGQKGISGCLPFDVVKLAIGDSKKLARPKAAKAIDKQKVMDMLPYSRGTVTNPAKIKHFYSGSEPPWSDAIFPCMAASDLLRIEAYELHCAALQRDFLANEQDAGVTT